MKCGDSLNCILHINRDYYNKLNDDGKELFMYSESSHSYTTSFPAEACSEQILYGCITAFCEVSVITLNPIYQIAEDTDIHCDIFRMGSSPHHFTLLIDITYAGNSEVYHDIMNFEIVRQTSHSFEFKLMGDQTLFSLDSISLQTHHM